MGPSVRDIAKAIQVSSPDTAQKHLDRMVNKGLVKRMTSGHRTIRVVPGSMPQHCHHFWKVVKIEGEILTVLCLWCNHKTEKEYTLDTENTKTLLRYYEQCKCGKGCAKLMVSNPHTVGVHNDQNT